MNKNEFEEIKLEFPLGDVANKLLRKMQELNGVTAHLFHAIQTYDEKSIPPPQTDNLPFIVVDETGIIHNDVSKESTLDWVFRMVFQEFVVGLSETLGVCYRCLKFYSLATNSKHRNL